MLRYIHVLSLCVLLAACAAQSPPRTDPLADLVGNAKITDSPTRVITDAKTKSLALIVSTSAETQIKHRENSDKQYLEGYVKTWESKSYNAVKTLQDSVSPRKLVETVVSELRQRFKNVTVVADLAEFKERSHDVAAVVDVGMGYNANGKATEYGERSNVGDIAKAFLLELPDHTPDEMMRPLVKAEKRAMLALPGC